MTGSLQFNPAGATTPIPGEILTQAYKSAGYTVACTLNWMSLFVVGMVFPILVVSLLKKNYRITHNNLSLSLSLKQKTKSSNRSICTASASSYSSSSA